MCSMSSSRPMWSKSAWRPSPKDLGCNMKKFSKSHHGTMHELNITPLLDLAFVLLVIVIITTTPLVEDKDLALPTASSRPKDPPRKPNYVSVDAQGNIFLNMKPLDLPGLYEKLVEYRTKDPDL